MWNIFNKLPKFTFVQSKRFPPAHNLPDRSRQRKQFIWTSSILAWGKSRVLSSDPPFFHGRDNNDGRPLHGTWGTLCMNKHVGFCQILPVGHRRHPFPWAATLKLPSALKQIPILVRANPGDQHLACSKRSDSRARRSEGSELRLYTGKTVGGSESEKTPLSAPFPL